MCTVPLTQSRVKAYKDKMKQTYGCKNDNARSMSICYATKGTVIIVYDDGHLHAADTVNHGSIWSAQQHSTSADSTIIKVEGNLSGCESISTFERTQKVGNVSVESFGSLDGKVSSFEYQVGERTWLMLEKILN